MDSKHSNMESSSKINALKTKLAILGPGLVMAGATIGVSHLVQATRAGAEFGFQLLGIVLLANILKYPFFEYGHRYYAATGEDLLTGYKKLHPCLIWLFLALNLFTGLGAICVLAYVTGSLLQIFLPFAANPIIAMAMIMACCLALLIIGRYRMLDRVIKVLLGLLIVFTVIALAGAWQNYSGFSGEQVSPWQEIHFPFLIALMGWMPGPLEISVWQSLWCKARDRYTKHKLTLQAAKFDFNFGYGASVAMSAVFLALGALVMHGQNSGFADSGALFASQLVAMYTHSMGPWIGGLVAMAAFATLFSTALTVLDAYPRSIAVAGLLAFTGDAKHEQRLTILIAFALSLLGLFLVGFYAVGFRHLVDLVTILSFLTAPVFAYMNYRLIYSKHTPQAAQGSKRLKFLSQVGLVYLIGFALIYLGYMFF